MGYPAFSIDMGMDSFMPNNFVMAFACAFLLDIFDDLKDMVLIFGKAKQLMSKVCMRKLRAQAKLSMAAATEQADPHAQSAAAAKSGSRSNKVAPL